MPDNALRAAETFAEYTGAVFHDERALLVVAEVDTQDAVVTLRTLTGESVLIFLLSRTLHRIFPHTPAI